MAGMADEIVQHLVPNHHLVVDELFSHVDVVLVGPARDAHPARAGKLVAGYTEELQPVEVAPQPRARLGRLEPRSVFGRRIERLVHLRRDRVRATAREAEAQEEPGKSAHASRWAPEVGRTMTDITEPFDAGEAPRCNPLQDKMLNLAIRSPSTLGP